LNLDVEIETRTIRRTGCSGEVVLNGPRQWQLFYELYCAGEAGVSPDDLITAIWPGKDKAEGRSCLDKAKSAADEKLLKLQIEIAAKKASGIWRLQSSRQSEATF
jgi:hypothetical protein